jgi:hypothetical protein
MAEQIQDGTGKGYLTKVNADNRMETFSIVEARVADVAANNGKAFLLSSGFVSLTTTASFNGLMYVKNNSDEKLFIDKIRTCSDGSGSVQLEIIANPTTGTLISDANNSNKLSSNMGSSEIFDGLSYAASADAKTDTDGDNLSQFINRSPGHSVQNYQGSLVLPKGSAIAIQAKPSVATTICIEIQCWFD